MLFHQQYEYQEMDECTLHSEMAVMRVHPLCGENTVLCMVGWSKYYPGFATFLHGFPPLPCRACRWREEFRLEMLELGEDLLTSSASMTANASLESCWLLYLGSWKYISPAAAKKKQPLKKYYPKQSDLFSGSVSKSGNQKKKQKDIIRQKENQKKVPDSTAKWSFLESLGNINLLEIRRDQLTQSNQENVMLHCEWGTCVGTIEADVLLKSRRWWKNAPFATHHVVADLKYVAISAATWWWCWWWWWWWSSS